MNQTKFSAVVLLLNDARGQYIPQNFTQCYDVNAWGLSADSWAVKACAEGPDNSDYWDAWCHILDTAKHTDVDGNVFYLHQDGDLWALCYDRMTEEEKHNFGMDD